MSTKTKLLALTEGLELGPREKREAASPSEGSNMATVPVAQPTSTIRFPPVPTGPLPRTAPGQMLQVRSQILAAEGEAGKLREQLKQFEGSTPTRKLDTSLVLPSRWANRHPQAFDTPAFARLKQDIEGAGGNVQAISVRPLAGSADKFEIVFGHRRHRACAELGLPVLATIDAEAMTDADLFSAMDRENRERADLSPFEQGAMYRRALDEKLYSSNRRLAEALGVSHTWVANVLMVADLPAPLIECFRSPLEIQHRHAKVLLAAFETDRKSLLRRADKFRQQGRAEAPAAVVDALIGTPRREPEATPNTLLTSDGRQVGTWTVDRLGRFVITVEQGIIDPDRTAAVFAAIAKELAH